MLTNVTTLINSTPTGTSAVPNHSLSALAACAIKQEVKVSADFAQAWAINGCVDFAPYLDLGADAQSLCLPAAKFRGQQDGEFILRLGYAEIVDNAIKVKVNITYRVMANGSCVTLTKGGASQAEWKQVNSAPIDIEDLVNYGYFVPEIAEEMISWAANNVGKESVFALVPTTSVNIGLKVNVSQKDTDKFRKGDISGLGINTIGFCATRIKNEAGLLNKAVTEAPKLGANALMQKYRGVGPALTVPAGAVVPVLLTSTNPASSM